MTDYKIAPATVEDILTLVDLVNGAYRGETSKKGWTNEADILKGIRTDEASLTKLIRKPNVTILKYLDKDNELQGCVYLEKIDNKLYLGMLTVSPEAQAQGIGKQLMEASEKFARENDCKAIEMTVITVRHELIAWYERRGYSKTNILKPFPADPKFGTPKQPLEFVVMEKLL